MKTFYIFLLIILCSFFTLAIDKHPTPKIENRIKIAILDSGFNYNNLNESYLCSTGHKSFADVELFTDNHGHGTSVTNLILKNLNVNKYCVIIIKVNFSTPNPYVMPLKYLLEEVKPQFINISGGGDGFQSEEYHLLSRSISSGIKVAVAAGNDGKTFTKDRCTYYPACYAFENSNFKVVSSSKTFIRQKDKSGPNQGPHVTNYEYYCDDTPMCGTSQATAIFTNKWVQQ